MSMQQRAIVSVLALGTVAIGGACQKQYPNCKAFDFGDLLDEPTIVDDDASPTDCGMLRVTGPKGAPVVEGSQALDCALEHIAEGHPMQVSLHQEPEDDWGQSWAIFSGEDGRAMRWRKANEDLNDHIDARVYELDTSAVDDCRALEDAGERYVCLAEAFEAGEVVKTCGTKELVSE